MDRLPGLQFAIGKPAEGLSATSTYSNFAHCRLGMSRAWICRLGRLQRHKSELRRPNRNGQVIACQQCT